jgi:2,4-dienoyl-CoA reductase-like NADH-dependent reductase (Old Yellow Enzyme family)
VLRRADPPGVAGDAHRQRRLQPADHAGEPDAAAENAPADLVAVGRAFIANSDLVRRLQLDAPLNPADETSFYGGTDAEYIDYPELDQAA